MTLGNKIKLLRLKKGVTQEMVAQEFHVSSQNRPCRTSAQSGTGKDG